MEEWISCFWGLLQFVKMPNWSLIDIKWNILLEFEVLNSMTSSSPFSGVLRNVGWNVVQKSLKKNYISEIK